MIFLWLSISCSVGIYLLFKIRSRIKANLTHAIIINYLTAAILGAFLHIQTFNFYNILNKEWLPIAFLIGFLFVVMFFLIGISSEKAGLSVTTMATRMSMIFPIAVSMFFFEDSFSFSKSLKISLAIIAVLLSIYKKPEVKNWKSLMLLPFILFIGSGVVDSLLKVAQHNFVPDSDTTIFSSTLFAISFITSIALLIIKKPTNEISNFKYSILLGLLLGLVNFGSLYFLIKALNHNSIESSMVFGINNLSIVCISILLGLTIFNEKLSKINWFGVLASIVSLILLIKL